MALRPEAVTQLVDWSLAPHKLSLVVNTCNPRNWKVKARRAGVQGYPGLRREFEGSLRYMRSLLSSGEGTWRRGDKRKKMWRRKRRGGEGREGNGREGKGSLGFASEMHKMPRALSMGCTVVLGQQVQALWHTRRLLGPGSHSHPRDLPDRTATVLPWHGGL